MAGTYRSYGNLNGDKVETYERQPVVDEAVSGFCGLQYGEVIEVEQHLVDPVVSERLYPA